MSRLGDMEARLAALEKVALVMERFPALLSLEERVKNLETVVENANGRLDSLRIEAENDSGRLDSLGNEITEIQTGIKALEKLISAIPLRGNEKEILALYREVQDFTEKEHGVRFHVQAIEKLKSQTRKDEVS